MKGESVECSYELATYLIGQSVMPVFNLPVAVFQCPEIHSYDIMHVYTYHFAWEDQRDCRTIIIISYIALCGGNIQILPGKVVSIEPLFDIRLS